MDKISKFFRFLTKFWYVGRFYSTLACGITFGIVYGAGIIIQSSKEGNIPKGYVFNFGIFNRLPCYYRRHTYFVAVGANGYILCGLRILAATIITLLLSRRIRAEQVQLDIEAREN